MSNRFKLFVFTFAATAALNAAPQLRLSQTALGPFIIAQGQNGATQTVDAGNVGTGSLSLQASSSVPWLVPTIGAARPCAFSQTCVPVQIALQTASLAKGSYTGFVTVSDPNAVDAPQTISVTVKIGGDVPDKLDLFAPPGGSASAQFITSRQVTTSAATQTGGNWLSVAVNGAGSFQFNVPYLVTATAQNGMAAGDFNGTITVSGSPFAGDNKTVPVTLHVTTQPIAQPISGVFTAGTTTADLRIAQGAAKQTALIVVLNHGQGTLNISGVNATTASGGNWLTATNSGPVVTLTADPTGLSPGSFQGTVTISSNAANGALTIPVNLTIVPQTSPVAAPGGVVNNVTFGGAEPLAQGDFVAVFGQQLTLADAAAATAFPFTTNFNGTQVFVNDQPVPVQFVSATQVNIQIPYDSALGPGTLRVDRNGQRGNTVSIRIDARAPRLYPFFQTPQGALIGSPAEPLKAGDTITLYAIGLGPTTPAVQAGTAAPTSPLAVITPTPQVCFGNPGPFSSVTCTTPAFAGLTPGFAGLYQINFTVPANAPKGNSVPVFLEMQDEASNVLQVAIQ